MRRVQLARRLLLAQPRQRRLAVEQRAEGRAVGVHLQQQRVAQRRIARPRGRAVRRSGRGRRRRPPRRSGSARTRSAARRRRRAAPGCARPVGWLRRGARSAPATRRPPAAGAAGGPPRRPAGGPAIRARCPGRRASSAIRTGCVRPGRRRARAGRRPAHGRPRPPAGRARPASRRRVHAASPARAAGKRAKRSRSTSRASVCMRSQSLAFAGDEDRRVARQPRPGARRHRPAPAARRTGRHAGGRGWRCASGSRASAGSRLASSRSTKWSRSAPPCAPRHRGDLGRGSPPAAIADSASCRPSGQPSVRSCRRAAASRSKRVAEALVHQVQRLVELEAQLRRADHRALAIVDEVVDVEWQSARAATTARRLGGSVAQQVGQRLPRGGSGRRSASSTNSTMSSAVCATSASQAVMPSRPVGAAASSSVWPKLGRPAPVRTRQRQRLHQALRAVLRAAPAAKPPRAPCARCSRRHCASSEVLPKPAGACTRITGWSRRLLVVGLQARARHQMARHPRRRDLQQQVVARGRRAVAGKGSGRSRVSLGPVIRAVRAGHGDPNPAAVRRGNRAIPPPHE